MSFRPKQPSDYVIDHLTRDLVLVTERLLAAEAQREQAIRIAVRLEAELARLGPPGTRGTIIVGE